MQDLTDGFALDSKELNLFFDFSSELIVVIGPNGLIQKINPATERLLGYGSAELLQKSLMALIHPNESQAIQQMLEGQLAKAEARFLKKDGSFVWLLWHLSRIPGQNFSIFTASDLTEIKEVNNSISHSEAKLQQVLNDGKIGYWEVDFLKGNLTISDNIREWWGLSDDQPMDNETYINLIHPDDRNKMVEAQKAVFETMKPQELIHRTRKPDGSYIWIHGIGHPMIDQEGKLIGLMGTSMDITQKVELELALKDQQAKMLTSSRLSAIGEMASAMAHEINNPLAIIHLNAEALKDQILNGNLSHEFIRQRADKISQTAMRISRIIRSLRTLSRDGEGDPFEPISVQRILEDTLEICQQKLLNGDIRFIVDLPNEDVMILARPTQISQVLLNLFNNAYDATEKLTNRWIKVSIAATNSSVEIIVRDSGSGISHELSEKIFDPFYTTKDPSRGTGLGLSVSRSIITSHSGTLQINPKSQNTEFVIRIPRFVQQSTTVPNKPPSDRPLLADA